jgi:hypothetical protein
MAQNFDELTAEIGLVVSGILKTDLALLRGYSQAKARSIASFTVLLGEAYAAGRMSDEQLRRETEELERMVVRFVRNIQALATTTIERVLQGVGALLRRVLAGLTGLPPLGLPVAPGTIWGVGPA